MRPISQMTMRAKHLLLTLLWISSAPAAFAGCDGTMFGVTSEDPLLSSVDITFTPVYSSATTSGTSNCPDWDLASYEQQARFRFLVANREQLQEQIATGHGEHVNALATLFACSPTGQAQFASFLRLHQQRLTHHLDHSSPQVIIPEMQQWIHAHPSLRYECSAS
jgi:hypothetical protein